MSRAGRRSSAIWFVWGWPIALSVLTVSGLLAALLGQTGPWLWLSWGALSTPLAAILRCMVLTPDSPR